MSRNIPSLEAIPEKNEYCALMDFILRTRVGVPVTAAKRRQCD